MRPQKKVAKAATKTSKIRPTSHAPKAKQGKVGGKSVRSTELFAMTTEEASLAGPGSAAGGNQRLVAQDDWRRIISTTSSMRETALAHAETILGEAHKACAENLVFRCGRCDVCRGPCLCWEDDLLEARLLTGWKPVGTFAFKEQEEQIDCMNKLQEKELSVWSGQNRWKMWIVVASLDPDKAYICNGLNITPRTHAFNQDFIDEKDEWNIRGILYGYRLPDE